MADFPMLRNMEDFLINPTFATDEQLPSPMASESFRRSMQMMSPHFTLKAGEKTPEPSTTIRNLVNEPLYMHGYNSEEEMASPIEPDDPIFDSPSGSDAGRLSHESAESAHYFPEQLALSCNKVEQQCSRAQAVKLVPAGKARMISMPKLVDVRAAPRMKRPADTTPIHPPVSRMNLREAYSQTNSQSSRHVSPRTSGERSPVSTAPSSIIQVPRRVTSLRRRPSLPALHALPPRSRPAIPQSVTAPTHLQTAADFLKQDPFPQSSEEAPMTPMSPSRRKLRKFSSSLGLNVFGRGLKRSEATDSPQNPDLETLKEHEPVLFPATFPSTPTVSNKDSAKPRMIPRGANEREPPLVLPPCPENYDDDEDDKENNFNYNYYSSGQWPARQVSTDASNTPQTPRIPKMHKRQRSYSAALVTAQA